MRYRYVQDLREEIAFLKEKAEIENREIAFCVASIISSKKGEDLVILDLRQVASFCDYFVIASAGSLRQTNAIAQAIEEDLRKKGIKSLSRVSSVDESGWIVMDLSSVVVHIFHAPMRQFYEIERLWSDAKKVRIPKSVLK